MCKSIIAWVDDPTETNAHNRRPVFCDEYIEALETRLAFCDNNFTNWLRSLRRRLGLS